MNLARQFFRRPQRLWARQACFQLHLWVGLLLTLYLVVIGITGSILVFRNELEALSGAAPWHNVRRPTKAADIVSVLDNVETVYPRARVTLVLTPSASDPTFVATIFDRERGRIEVAADPTSGAVLGEFPEKQSWLDVILRLHETLLIGPSGRRVNGGAAAALLVLNVTGLILWWPGVTRWTRALGVDFARGWRRINFDAHRAVGFWTLAISSFWAISGIYFAWPAKTFAWIDRISPVVSARPPVVRVHPELSFGDLDLHALILQAKRLDPGTTLMGIAFPANRRSPIEVLTRRRDTIGYEYADTLYFDPYNGRYLSIWRYGVNQSWGDWFIWLQIPLHYGTYWGLGVKIIWAFCGLTIALLAVTGALMYWNRYLRRKWKRLRLATSLPMQHLARPPSR